MFRPVFQLTFFMVLATALTFLPGSSYAASWAGGLLQGAIQAVSARQQVVNLDNHGQKEVLAHTKDRVGYYEDYEYQARARRILDDLQATGVPKRDYVIFVNPDENINAFLTLAGVISVNKGTMDVLDDHQLAFVLAHEMSHGEHRDIVNGTTKKLTLSTAAQAVLRRGDISVTKLILMNLGTDFVQSEVFTMKQERNADELGFKVLSHSSYNIGGAAAAMSILLQEDGNQFRSGITRIIAPNTHPRTQARVDAALKRLTEYSRGHVEVKDKQVYLNRRLVLSPKAMGNTSAEVRAYYVAGKLARLFHEEKLIRFALQGQALYGNDVSLYTFSRDENAEQVLRNFEAAYQNKSTDKVQPSTMKSDRATAKKSSTVAKKDTSKADSKKKKSADKKDAKQESIVDRVQDILHPQDAKKAS